MSDLSPTSDAAALLAVYDERLRGEAEVVDAQQVQRHGPLWWARFWYGGFVTCRSLDGLTGADLDELVAASVAHLDGLGVTSAEWKTRGHDRTADGSDLGPRLLAAGFEPDPVETVMVGAAEAVAAVPVALPDRVRVLRVDDGTDRDAWLTRAVALQQQVFGGDRGGLAGAVERLERSAGLAEFWVVEAHGEVLCAGRLEEVADTGCAGLWGGGTREDWRGRGLYRALVAARARSALDRGLTWLHSDCTSMSRPILERAGLVAVTTTTPYVRRR